MKRKGWARHLYLIVIWLGGVGLWSHPVQAQESDLRYQVQPNETLIEVAVRYNLSLPTLILANRLISPYLILPGQSLILPGVPASELLLAEAPPLRAEPHVVQAGDTLFTISQHYGVSMGGIILVNNLADPDLLEIGQILQIPENPPVPQTLPAPFAEVILSEPTIIQGRTLVVKVGLAEPATLSGSFEGRALTFNEDGAGRLWTIIAIHALTEPNLYPIALSATQPDNTQVHTFVNVEVVAGPYDTENIQLDSERGQLLTDDLIQQERNLLVELWSQLTPQAQWSGPFFYPVASDTLQFTSYFGTRRSYNDSPPTSFHGGTDFGGGVGTPIYAPAAGTVVLADTLTLRGNAVLIDHGMGLFSGYWHQSEIVVSVGQTVEPGDLIGYIGNTGLVTGPHLHWEMRLQGIAVEPTQWVQQTIP